MFDFTDSAALQRSFAEFARQPANAPLVERAQQEELLESLDARDAAMLQAVRIKLEEADAATRDTLAPLLRYPVLARLVHSLFNDPSVSPANPHSADFERLTAPRLAATTPEQLSAAMNEQLEERQLGNRAYAAGDPRVALRHYERGLAVLRLLQPDSPHDAAVVQEAQVTLLLNTAAAYLAAGEPGAAVAACGRALELDPGNAAARVRRAKALMARREYQAAAADLDAAEQLWGGSRGEELRALRAQLRMLRQRDEAADRGLYSRMFR
ncbi:hypothetical protein GPECTOR_35g920 [Gonium pectorale]|uniref:Uncharacterized protein n=1 Tax=Gonium pectorale TaxID=33097 RepID=A0A150GCB0_GONPE|nr:hypothetical protein GPECTOR_35g920 [Gonium pectorale]|eukprot:KXZ47482.1 hypothetical protein GPECTOR_35g920 [Gonium pectorale]